MKKWEKLNREFDEVLDKLTQSDWENWYNSKESKKEMKRLTLLLKAKLQEEKLSMIQISIKGESLVKDYNLVSNCLNSNIINNNDYSSASYSELAFAA